MHYDLKVECWDAEHVYTHTWMAYLLFHNFHFCRCHLVAQVAFWAEVVLQAEVGFPTEMVFWVEGAFLAEVAPDLV